MSFLWIEQGFIEITEHPGIVVVQLCVDTWKPLCRAIVTKAVKQFCANTSGFGQVSKSC